MNFVLPALGVASLCVLVGCSSGSDGPSDMSPPPPSTPSVHLTRVFPALAFSAPVYAVQAPGDDARWFVVEQAGRVLVFDNVDTVTTATPFIDITDRVRSGGETGLLGMAFDPEFASNGRVFLSYTRDLGQLQSVLSVFTSTDGGTTLDPATERVLLTVDQPFTNHKGGHVLFGLDGWLYMSLGDGGSAGDPDNNAQNTANLLGKILRLDVGSGTDYTIPSDNPFAGNPRCAPVAGTAPCPEIYAFGLRNPWRFSFESGTDALWVGDVGQDSWEEIDVVVAGGNYGWRFREGAHCFNPASNCPTTSNGAELIDPVAEYDHSVGESVTGGYVYRGAGIPALAGQYVFADFISGRVFAYTPGSATRTPVELLDSPLGISSFAVDLDGELYVVDYDGALYRLDAGSGS